MRYWAELDGTTVVNIVVTGDEGSADPALVEYGSDNPAFIGGDYVGGHFYAPQPFPSWQRSQGQWVPPVPMPSDSDVWAWDEVSQSWLPLFGN
jgi:hypothetical protein